LNFLKRYRYLLLLLVSIFSNKIVVAQVCPINIDFEKGDFTGWKCYVGSVAAVGGQNVITLDEVPGPEPDRHDIISSFPIGGMDPFGNFPTSCPNGSGYSIKLGNTGGGNRAEGVSYEFTIPANKDVYNLIYHYAVVFEDPNHQQYEQPRMEIEVTNVTDGTTINCSSFSFFPYGTPLPGFEQSPITISNAPIWYKKWTPVSVNLNGLAGKHIRLFFKTSDCTFRRHFGYAYIDIDSQCDGNLEGASYCPDDTEVNVVAPYGFQSYTWYNSTFTQVLGTQQILSIPPPPAPITVAVVVVPYNGYGCIDTLYAQIIDNLQVVANAGKDTISCNNTPAPIGGPPQLGVVYSWSPATGLSSPNIANPIALPSVTTQYVLTAKSRGGGCIETDTVIVKAEVINDAINLLGKDNYCIGSGDSAVLVVQLTDSIQWYKNGVAIIGETKQRYTVTETGDYYATLFGEFGCIVKTITRSIKIATIPDAIFSVNEANQCLNGNEYIFTNNSSNDIGDMTYQWILGDGRTSTSLHITHKYTKAGKYEVKLIVNSSEVCADTFRMPIIVYQNAIANFSTKSTCVNVPVEFINTTADTLGSRINYLWQFPNGQTSTLRTPPTLTFNATGVYHVVLAVYSDQCPTPPHSLRKPILIEKPLPAMAYPVAYAVENFPLDLEARKIGETVLWNPINNLSSATSFTPIFNGNTETLYTIDIKTRAGCVTTDTQLVKFVKNVKVFVPNAFTPNGDNFNNLLRPVTFGIKQLKSFKVFNRWGQLFYQTSSLKQGWDGTFKGVPQEMQTLVWFVDAIGVDGKTYSYKGTTTLVR
jgi:gliding motility-associated-like protein